MCVYARMYIPANFTNKSAPIANSSKEREDHTRLWAFKTLFLFFLFCFLVLLILKFDNDFRNDPLRVGPSLLARLIMLPFLRILSTLSSLVSIFWWELAACGWSAPLFFSNWNASWLAPSKFEIWLTRDALESTMD